MLDVVEFQQEMAKIQLSRSMISYSVQKLFSFTFAGHFGGADITLAVRIHVYWLLGEDIRIFMQWNKEKKNSLNLKQLPLWRKTIKSIIRKY